MTELPASGLSHESGQTVAAAAGAAAAAAVSGESNRVLVLALALALGQGGVEGSRALVLTPDIRMTGGPEAVLETRTAEGRAPDPTRDTEKICTISN